MKENKTIIYCLTVIIVITLIIAFALALLIKEEDNVITLINNIVLNILGGAIITMMISIVSYKNAKRKNLELLIYEINSIIKLYTKIQYLEEMEFCSESEYLSRMLNNNPKNIRNHRADYVKLYDEYTNKQYKKMEEIEAEYIDLAKYNLNNLTQVYNDIDFVFARKKKYKEEIYLKIISINQEMQQEILQHIWYQSSIIKDSREKRYKKILDLQEKVFVRYSNVEDIKNQRCLVHFANYSSSTSRMIYNKLLEKQYDGYNLLEKILVRNNKK